MVFENPGSEAVFNSLEAPHSRPADETLVQHNCMKWMYQEASVHSGLFIYLTNAVVHFERNYLPACHAEGGIHEFWTDWYPWLLCLCTAAYLRTDRGRRNITCMLKKILPGTFFTQMFHLSSPLFVIPFKSMKIKFLSLPILSISIKKFALFL